MKHLQVRGFAVISLIVSILIIALIVFISFSLLTRQQGGQSSPVGSPLQRARSVECLAQIRKIELQIQLYSAQNGRYPQSLYVLEALSESDFRCPVTQDYYDYDPQSGRISCPAHTR